MTDLGVAAKNRHLAGGALVQNGKRIFREHQRAHQRYLVELPREQFSAPAQFYCACRSPASVLHCCWQRTRCVCIERSTASRHTGLLFVASGASEQHLTIRPPPSPPSLVRGVPWYARRAERNGRVTRRSPPLPSGLSDYASRRRGAPRFLKRCKSPVNIILLREGGGKQRFCVLPYKAFPWRSDA